MMAQPPLKPFMNVDAESSEGRESLIGDQNMPDQQASSKKTSFISLKYNGSQVGEVLKVIEERLES
jgi:hypothetical protein